MTGFSTTRFLAALGGTLREYRRTPTLLGLLVALPFLFILVSIAVSPTTRIPVRIPIDGLWLMRFQQMPDVHSIVMVPVTTSVVAGLGGLFLMQTADDADERLVAMGYGPMEVVSARIAALSLLVCVVTAISVAVMHVHFRPRDVGVFVAGTLLVTSTYGFVGMVCGAGLRRLPGLYVMLFGPLMDVGVFQNPMFVHGEQPVWMELFPGHYPVQVLLDAGFTPGFDTWNYLAVAVLYAGTVGCIAIAINVRLIDNPR